MLSAVPGTRCLPPSKNIRLKKRGPRYVGNVHYRRIASTRSQSRLAGGLTSLLLGGTTGGRGMMSQSKHILVVDDNGDVRDVIVDTLQEHSYRVSAASSGSMMRDFLETDDTVDCVILDALMPGEVSASLALHLKERGIPVVM